MDEMTLGNGLKLIGEHLPHFHSVTVGIWLGVGSQHEEASEAGLSHFLEHMLFKGTARRTAKQIAQEMDAVGGQINAFTSKECTCYYAKVIDEHLPLAMDVLCDMVRNATIAPGDLGREKGVIIEEISMVEDTPEDIVHDLLNLAWFGGQPLGRPILGTAELVRAYKADDLKTYRKRMYRPDNAVIAIAGNYNWAAFCELASALMGDWPRGEGDIPGWPDNPACGQLLYKEKDIEQTHICVGLPGVAQISEGVYPLSVFNNLFGGAMSSRLFQRIREEKGMAYAVYSYPTPYVNCGLFTIYAGTSPQNARQVLELIRDEIDVIKRDGPGMEEVNQAREQLKGSFILSLESASGKMHSLGRRKLLFGDVRREEQVLASINAVSYEDVERVMRLVFSGPCALSLVGPDVATLDTGMFIPVHP